jgi:uncharacterized protein
MAIQALDSRPWFKQFWPWFLILLPASVVVAATITMIIAHTGADDLVAENYYKDGLAINRRLEKEGKAALLGISSTLTVTETAVRITLTAPSLPSSLTLKLSHPLEADSDFSLTLLHSEPGIYQAGLPHPIAVHWHWLLEPPAPANWELNGRVRPGDFVDEG